MSVERDRLVRWALLLGMGGVMMAATGCARRVAVRATTPAPQGVVVYQAPPQQQVVVQRPVQPYANAVWVDGHYEWNGQQYVWVPGYWVQQRAGYQFVQPRWVRRGNGYVYVRGGWGRGGRVVHYVNPGPRRVRVRGPGVRVRRGGYVGPRRTVVRRGPRRTVVRTRTPRGTVVRRQGPRGSVTVRRRGPVRRRGVQVRTRGARGATVRVRP